jgi:hypothetical protein
MLHVVQVLMARVGPLYLVDRELYSHIINWEQAVFESVKQGET